MNEQASEAAGGPGEGRAAGLTVYIVDDDPAVGDSLSQMLRLLGYATRVFTSAEAMLDACTPDWTGCVVADLRLPGMNGVELQEALARKGRALPFLIVTGNGDVPAARDAFRARALDFIEKPIDEGVLVAAIETGMKAERLWAEQAHSRRDLQSRLARLTPREREVLELVGMGLPAKEVAARLGISQRTAEIHKAHIMEKTQSRNVSELVRLVLGSEQLRK